MAISKTNFQKVVSLLAVTMLPTIAAATPTVEGNTIQWTEDGWHQVQLQSTYESVCNGGRQCTVPTGVYTVINHGTGQRFMDIAVPNESSDSGDLPLAPVVSTRQVVSYAFGDDGDYQSGVSAAGQRFQDNSNGTFEDTLTGLTWLSVRDCVLQFTWGPGIEYANNFSETSADCPELSDGSVAGDWRVPNVKELGSLVQFAEAFPAWYPEIPLSGTWIDDPTGSFWSSTSFVVALDSAIALNSAVGFISASPKATRSYYVWPVRDSN